MKLNLKFAGWFILIILTWESFKEACQGFYSVTARPNRRKLGTFVEAYYNPGYGWWFRAWSKETRKYEKLMTLCVTDTNGSTDKRLPEVMLRTGSEINLIHLKKLQSWELILHDFPDKLQLQLCNPRLPKVVGRTVIIATAASCERRICQDRSGLAGSTNNLMKCMTII